MPQQQGWRLPTTEELEKALKIAKEEGLYYPFSNANKQDFKTYYPFLKEQRLGSEQGLPYGYQLSRQQGRSVPFSEEQGRRVPLPKAQKWQITYSKGQGVPGFAYEQKTSDEVNSEFGI